MSGKNARLSQFGDRGPSEKHIFRRYELKWSKNKAGVWAAVAFKPVQWECRKEAVLQRGRWLSETKEDSWGEGKTRKKKKKKRVISPHPASFLFKHKLCLSGPCPSLFSLPLLSFPSQSAPSITYSLSLFPLITARLLSSPASPPVSILVKQREGGKHTPDGPSLPKNTCN